MAAPPVDCPADCGWTWTQTWFGDCVCGDRDEASFLLGLASILAWGTAELPQIYANFKNGKSEGVSFAFVATWLTGDCFNLLGCAVSPTLPTQLYTALLYTATTIVLIVQHVYYNARRAESSDARILKNLPEEDLEDLEARLLDDSHPESPESPAGEGEEERGDDAATPEGASPSRATRPTPKTRATTKSDAGPASGETAARSASRPSRRKPRRSWRREEKPPQKPPDVPRRAASPSAAPAGGHRAARHSLPSSTKPSSARTGRREGGSASRDRDRGANASGGGSGGLISASVPSRGGFSARTRGREYSRELARAGRGPRRAPRGRSSRERRRAVLAVVRTRPPLRRRLGAGSRGGVPPAPGRRGGAGAPRVVFGLAALPKPQRERRGRRGNEGVNEGNEGNEGGSAARRGRRGGGLSRAAAAAAATTGSVGVAAFGGPAAPRGGGIFFPLPRAGLGFVARCSPPRPGTTTSP